jgi:uncharacterized SAM-binding protein YcdF (DUF218 family)
MTTAPEHRRAVRRWVSALALALAASAIFVTIICYQIVQQAAQQDLRRASAIVVFGAAEYSGRPSPVYRARLDRAWELYQAGLAPLVITTGGAGGDPSFSEGGVGRDYLMRRGIPENQLIAETQGTDTAESVQRVAQILRANGLRDCLAVSDEYHLFRIRRMLETEGITVYAAPRMGSRPRSFWQRVLAVLREASSYCLWRLRLT